MNGNSKLFWWALGTLAMVRRHSEHIAVLESQMGDTKQQLDKIDRLLDLQTRAAGGNR